jgi:hypothetical protein
MNIDLELTTAHRDLLSLDHSIAKLYDRFGERVDGKTDFIEAEERRFAALDCLARALKALSIAEDPNRQAVIAASPADGVIRYFNRSA